MRTISILALILLLAPAGPLEAGEPGLVRRLETLNPAPYRLTLKGGDPGSLRIADPQRPGAWTTLERPGSAAIIANPAANAGSVSTWPLEFRGAGAATPAAGSWDLELADGSGQVRMAFRVTLRPGEPRLRVTMAPGSFDTKNLSDGRGYYVKGPVTVVEETRDQDVLIWIGPEEPR